MAHPQLDADDAGSDGEPVRFPQANMVAVSAIAGALATTLGPTPRDKLIVKRLATRHEPDRPSMPATDEFYVANDGATILQELPLEHPISPVVRRLIGPERPGDTDVEGEDIPDGVASAVVLTGALLDEAEELLDAGVHPYDIQRGYDAAADVARSTLERIARDWDEFPSPDEARRAVARSAMTGNDVRGLRNRWARLAVEAADLIGMPDERTLAVQQVSAGSMDDSRLVHGAVLPRNEVCHDDMPKRVENAHVLVLSGYYKGGGLTDPDVSEDVTIRPSDPGDLDLEDDVFSARRGTIIDTLVDAGVDVVIAHQGITQPFQRALADVGIMGIRGVTSLPLAHVALATGATFVQDPIDVAPDDLGSAGVVEEIRREPRRHRRKTRRMIVVDECDNPASVCILLRGMTGHLGEQATTDVRKAVAAVATAAGERAARPGVVPGAGAMEMTIARQVRTAAVERDSRAQLSMSAFASATERLVAQLARNAGADPIDVVSTLQAAHDRGEKATGIRLPSGTLEDAYSAGIFDPVDTRLRVYRSATAVANQILRIDDAIDAVDITEPAGPDEAIYDEPAEQHMDYLKEHDDTRWG